MKEINEELERERPVWSEKLGRWIEDERKEELIPCTDCIWPYFCQKVGYCAEENDPEEFKDYLKGRPIRSRHELDSATTRAEGNKCGG